VTSIQLLSDLEKYAEYDDESMYAPIFGTRKDDAFTISKVKNPFKSSLSLTHLNVADESKYSQRELAQQSNIFDTETGKYLDYTAEDLGLFKGLFHKPIAYAKYEEDVEEFDPNIGRVVKHRKGEYKLNPEGNFYTETVTDQEGYNKEFVALSDILFKESDWINKINVFESDDKHKSIGGVIMNTALHIAPYLFLGEAWGAVAAASIMMQQLPTLAKAVEGLIVPEGETQFTKKMNLFENYMRRFDHSMSDEAQ
jgi:hypothetical protein